MVKELLESELKPWFDTLLEEEYGADLRMHLLEVSFSAFDVCSPSVIALPDVRLLGHRVDFDPSLPLFVPSIVGRTYHASLPDVLVKDAGSRATISQDHFQVSVEPSPLLCDWLADAFPASSWSKFSSGTAPVSTANSGPW